MSYSLLSSLRMNQPHARICVRVTRKWEYKGPTDDGLIQHADLILADHQANAIYAEIPQDLVHEFNGQINEGSIYEISRFRVANAKKFYKPIDGHYMIYFTVHTRIHNPRNPPTTFPRYVYRLTPFEELPMLVGNCQNFIDVLAIIIQIGEPEMTQSAGSQHHTIIRKLVLRDANGVETRMTLWGQRAAQFSVDAVYNSNEAKPVVTLFVGCLMKTYFAQDTLSGSSACKWYFNPEIPEAEELYNSYANQRIEITHIATVPQQIVQPHPPPQQELRYLQDLQNIDPYEFPENGCQCTVTIARLVPDVSWWFPSCARCGKSCSLERTGYICYTCNNTNYRHKYKLLFVATDGTAEEEMICFGQVAQHIVGKPVEHVIRTVRRNEDFPPDIAGIVSQRYTFAITMSNQSYYTRNKSFVVNSIIASHGRQRAIAHAGPSSSSRQIGYHKDSAASASTRNAGYYRRRSTPPPSTQHYTPHPAQLPLKL